MPTTRWVFNVAYKELAPSKTGQDASIMESDADPFLIRFVFLSPQNLVQNASAVQQNVWPSLKISSTAQGHRSKLASRSLPTKHAAAELLPFPFLTPTPNSQRCKRCAGTSRKRAFEKGETIFKCPSTSRRLGLILPASAHGNTNEMRCTDGSFSFL